MADITLLDFSKKLNELTATMAKMNEIQDRFKDVRLDALGRRVTKTGKLDKRYVSGMNDDERKRAKENANKARLYVKKFGNNRAVEAFCKSKGLDPNEIGKQEEEDEYEFEIKPIRSEPKERVEVKQEKHVKKKRRVKKVVEVLETDNGTEIESDSDDNKPPPQYFKKQNELLRNIMGQGNKFII